MHFTRRFPSRLLSTRLCHHGFIRNTMLHGVNLRHTSSCQQSKCSSNNSPQNSTSFWRDPSTWKKASFNTFNCLVGCSIGDQGTMILFNIFFPHVGMMYVVPLAMFNGICTSMALETVILKVRNGFSWARAFRVAIRMSLLSMLIMELSENATDLMLWNYFGMQDGSAYWIALLIGVAMGFMVPLPYNYYMLKKFNKACH